MKFWWIGCSNSK